MQIVEEHRTPDGLLRLLVGRTEDGDFCLGFDGFQWHTHGDILSSLSGLPLELAMRRFIDELVSGHSVIAIARVSGEIKDVWVTDDLEEDRDDKYRPDDETLEFRYWDGRQAA
jgi:hypothetical protein